MDSTGVTLHSVHGKQADLEREAGCQLVHFQAPGETSAAYPYCWQPIGRFRSKPAARKQHQHFSEALRLYSYLFVLIPSKALRFAHQSRKMHANKTDEPALLGTFAKTGYITFGTEG